MSTPRDAPTAVRVMAVLLLMDAASGIVLAVLAKPPVSSGFTIGLVFTAVPAIAALGLLRLVGAARLLALIYAAVGLFGTVFILFNLHREAQIASQYSGAPLWLLISRIPLAGALDVATLWVLTRPNLKAAFTTSQRPTA